MINRIIQELNASSFVWKKGVNFDYLIDQIPSDEPHRDYLIEGFSYLQKGISNYDSFEISKAIRCFQRITEDDDKYLRAIKFFGLCISYTLTDRFGDAYDCIDKIDAWFVSFTTKNGDIIKEIRYMTREFKKDIYEIDQRLHPEFRGKLRRFFTIVS